MQQKTPQLIFYWRDATGSESTVRLSLPVGSSVATIASAAASLRPLLESLSDAAIVKQDIAYTWRDLSPPDPSTRLVGESGAFIFDTGVLNQVTIIVLPAASADLFVTSGPLAGIDIDLAQSDVAAFIAAINSGLWVNPFGYDLVECVAAYLTVKL